MHYITNGTEESILEITKTLIQNEFSCENLRIDSSQNRIYLDNNELILQPKVMQLLLFLCAANGQTLTKPQLNELLWPNTQVGPDSLANAMTRLRKALNDNSKQPQFIETVQRKGYRWLKPIEQVESKNNSTFIKYCIMATSLILFASATYWLSRSEPEKFPYTDLNIKKTESGMEVKVGFETDFGSDNQEKIKKEISRITGESHEQMEISVDPDCTKEQIANSQTDNCNLPLKIK